VVAATERRRMDSIDSSRPLQSGQPAPGLHHHHSMQGNVGGQAPPTPHSIAPHPNSARPGIDRAHTFPTPPTSASSILGIGNQGSSYEWGSQNLPNGVNGAQPLSIETALNARSMPTTPATTPPSNTTQNMQGYQGQPGYEKNPYNTTPGSQAGYSQQSDPVRYGQAATYTKTEMGPPTAPAASIDANDQVQVPTQGHTEHDGGEHHENGYLHGNPNAYAANRSQYGYPPAPEHPHLSPEMSGSPHQSGSGRGTPRTMPPSQPQWNQDYQTPPRPGTSSNVYSVIGNTNSTSVPSSGGNYTGSTYSGAGVKRGRGDDDDRPSSRDYDYSAKRQKSSHQDTFGMPLTAPHMQAIKSGGQR
jgi:enhanced filamentous growth protein 1